MTESLDSMVVSDVRDPLDKKTYPPHNCSIQSLNAFLEYAKATKLTIVNADLLKTASLTRSKYEYTLINALRFLHLIDIKGQPTENLTSLSSTGEVYKKNLERIVKEAYADLLSNVDVKIAKPEYVFNYFVHTATLAPTWKLTLAQAQDATQFFVLLATDVGIQLSEELMVMSNETESKQKKISPPKIKETSQSSESTTTSSATSKTPLARNSPSKLSKSVTMSNSNVQATITMSLDSNTSIEVWRMVLKLLGLTDLPQNDSISDKDGTVAPQDN